ncbi:MAG: YajG family lipoprotein [Pseudomonadota bacterium]
MKIQLIAAVAVMGLGMAGCATREDVVPVPYKVHGGAQIGAGVHVTVTVNDARTTDRTKIANKTNGYGMEMAAIRADRGVADIVKDAFEAELKSRGFAIGTGGSNATVAINNFYGTFQSHLFSGDALGDVKFHVSVMSPAGASAYDREVDVIGKLEGIQLASGSNAATALSDGMSKALDTLFADPAFVAALENHGAEQASSSKAGS